MKDAISGHVHCQRDGKLASRIDRGIWMVTSVVGPRLHELQPNRHRTGPKVVTELVTTINIDDQVIANDLPCCWVGH
jgi:hypothetical protein